jgi:hypothetical protein
MVVRRGPSTSGYRTLMMQNRLNAADRQRSDRWIMRPKALIAIALALPLLIAVTRTPHATPARESGRTPSADETIDLTAMSEELRMRLVAVRHLRASPRVSPGRNPFTFRPGEQDARKPAAAGIAAAAAPEVLDARRSEPTLELIGIAEHQVRGSAQRTGVITSGPGGDGLHFVRAGDILVERYRVERIGEADLQLLDLVTAAGRQLSLAR